MKHSFEGYLHFFEIERHQFISQQQDASFICTEMAYLRKSNLRNKLETMKEDLKMENDLSLTTEMVLDNDELLNEIIAFRFNFYLNI